MIIVYFLLFLLVLVLTILSTFLWSWIAVKLHYINNGKLCIEFFKNEVDFAKIIFFQNDRNFFYFFMFYFAEFCNLFLVTGFSILWFLIWNNTWYICGFIIWWFLSHFVAFLLIKNLLKQMRLISYENTKNSIMIFKRYLQQNLNNFKNKKVNFTLLKDNKKAKRDYPLQWNQKRCQKKLLKILNKNTSENRKLLKILRTLIWYLKVYAVLFKNMNIENIKYNLLINNKIVSINQIKSILVKNFWFYLQEKKV